MNQTLKKIIKYLIVFVVLGVIVFVGVKLIFPQPDPLDAYNNTRELTQLSVYEDLIENTDELLSLMEGKLSDESLNTANYNKLLYAKYMLTALNDVNANVIDDLAFAKNSSVYNANIKKSSKAFDDIKETYTRVQTYLTNNLSPFLEQNISPVSSLNMYSNAMLPFFNELCEEYQTYTHNIIGIVVDTDITIRNNEWSKTLLNITDAWSQNVLASLKNAETDFEAYLAYAEGFFNFTSNNVNATISVSYYVNFTAINSEIAQIALVDLDGATKNVLTAGEAEYVNSIEKATVKTATQNVMAFLKGI